MVINARNDVFNSYFHSLCICIIASLISTVFTSDSFAEHATDNRTPLRFGFDDAGGPSDLAARSWFKDMVKELGFDLWVRHYTADRNIKTNIQIIRQVDAICGRLGMKWVSNHEGANWVKTFIDEKGRDWYNREDGRHFELLPAEILKVLSKCDHFLGVMYDEAAHMQNCMNRIAGRTPHWKPYMYDPSGDRLEGAAEAFTKAVGQVAAVYGQYDIPLYTEHVFPVLFHGFARGGYTAGAKMLKESWCPVYIACAMGAAIQYNTELWLTPDLWHLSEYPGHSPEQYRSALLLAYHMGADSIYTENISYHNRKNSKDSLIRITPDGYQLTELGQVTKWFAKEYLPRHPRSYSFRQLKPRVAIV